MPAGTRPNNLIEFVKKVDAALDKQALHKSMAREQVYRIEAAKLRKAMSADPKLYTLRNLELALSYAYHERLKVTSPVALIYQVERAVKQAEKPVVQADIITQRDDALMYEKHHLDEQSDRWIRQLSRAVGAGLVDVVDRWKAARGR
jgi:hypothetical protein